MPGKSFRESRLPGRRLRVRPRASLGRIVDAFDISEAGIAKAKRIAESNRVEVNFFVRGLDQFVDWEMLRHFEGTFADEHPGGARHEHACERVVARKPR